MFLELLVHCFGINEQGQSDIPDEVQGEMFKNVSAGGAHTCADIVPRGGFYHLLYCWVQTIMGRVQCYFNSRVCRVEQCDSGWWLHMFDLAH